MFNGVLAVVTEGGYQLPLSPAMLALMPLIAAAVGLLRQIPIISKNAKWALPILSVLVGVAVAFVSGQPDPAQSGMAIGIATCYAYDLGKGAIKAVLPPK